jgi:predicted GNAT family N-acyltransferase
MFITRATRHDRADVEDFYNAHDWGDAILDRGVSFVARDGGIVAALRLIDIDPQTLVIEDVLVRSNRRGQGIGADLMRAAMNSRGGTVYVCCHAERLRFYGDLGFAEVPFEDLPDGVRAFFEETNAAPHQLPAEHIHHFLKAR